MACTRRGSGGIQPRRGREAGQRLRRRGQPPLLRAGGHLRFGKEATPPRSCHHGRRPASCSALDPDSAPPSCSQRSILDGTVRRGYWAWRWIRSNPTIPPLFAFYCGELVVWQMESWLNRLEQMKKNPTWFLTLCVASSLTISPALVRIQKLD
jgi:hypothetical protein